MQLIHGRGLELAGMPADLEAVSLRPFQEFRYGDRRTTLLLLLSASGFVFLLACTNVASLQLSRMATRTRDIAIRQTLGANTVRLLRPLLLETLLLASVGATLGLFLSVLLNRWLVASTPAILSSAPVLEIDVRVLGFVLGTTLLAAILTGVSPALQARRTSAGESLRAHSSAASAAATGRLSRGVLVASEVALTLIAVLTATLLIRSFGLLGTVDPGFNPANVIALELSSSGSGPAPQRDLKALSYELQPELEGLPGVRSVGATTSLPIESRAVLPYIDADRYVPGPSREGQAAAQFRGINPTYLETMGIPLLRGRGFTNADAEGSPGVVLINETAAKRHWRNEDPIGRRVSVFPDSVYAGPPLTVVGIVGDVSELALGESRRWDSLYVPLAQLNGPLARQVAEQVFVVVKSEVDPQSLVSPVRAQIWRHNAAQPIRRVTSMEEVMGHSLAPHEFRAVVTSGFALLALILAGVGIYAVGAFHAASRNRELAIRMALGSSPRQLVILILGQGFWPVVIGLFIGLCGAFAARRIADSLLYGVSVTDPAPVLAVVFVLVGTSLLSMLLPALRATRVDPMLALRRE
jgi:predicted permease